MSPVTQRLYARVWVQFDEWMEARGLCHPAAGEDLAKYLVEVGQLRSTSSVPLHASAIANHYRKQGWSLDTKQAAVARVLSKARAT